MIILLDDIQVIAYCLLPFILPSCGRRIAGDDSDKSDEENEDLNAKKRKRTKAQKPRKKLATIKTSDLSVLKSMIMFQPVLKAFV
jgi:hypothetical protein